MERAPEARAGRPSGRGDRWRSRRAPAAGVAILIVGLPIATSVAASFAFARAVDEPPGLWARIAYWAGLLAVSVAAFSLTERVARRAVPLSLLLGMDLLFPGAAPKRLAVARRAASTRDLARRLEQARTTGIPGPPSAVAEQIVVLAAGLSAHDRMTRGHAERVRAVTDLIADEMHLPTDRRDRLRWSALLHDIGKLTVHPDILNKPGRPSEEEWEVLRNHPLEGARITAPLAAWLGEWADTIAEHHERYDGKGYPFGLAGPAISLGGRIVAVADSYDVMTSVRSYKKAMAPTAARRELVACAGSQFDPDVVRALLSVPLRRLKGMAPLGGLGARAGDLASRLPEAARTVAGGLVSGAMAVVSIAGVSGSSSQAFLHHSGSGTAVSRTAAPGSGARVVPNPGVGPTVPGGADSPVDPGARSGGVGPGRAGSSGSSGSSTTSVPGSSGPGGSSGPPTTEPGVTTPGTTPSGPVSPGQTGTGTGGTSGGPVGGSSGPTTTAPGAGAAGYTSPTTGPSAGSGSSASGATTTTTTVTTAAPAAPAPPAAPSALRATGACEVVVLIPEVTLNWTPSPTPDVTGYTVERASGGGWTVVADLSGRTSASWADTSVSGGRSYTYEVVASSPSGSSASAPASATTPSLCL